MAVVRRRTNASCCSSIWLTSRAGIPGSDIICRNLGSVFRLPRVLRQRAPRRSLFCAHGLRLRYTVACVISCCRLTHVCWFEQNRWLDLSLRVALVAFLCMPPRWNDHTPPPPPHTPTPHAPTPHLADVSLYQDALSTLRWAAVWWLDALSHYRAVHVLFSRELHCCLFVMATLVAGRAWYDMDSVCAL